MREGNLAAQIGAGRGAAEEGMAERSDGGGCGCGDFLVGGAEHPAQVGREQRHRRRIGSEIDVGERRVEEDAEALATGTPRVPIGDGVEHGRSILGSGG